MILSLSLSFDSLIVNYDVSWYGCLWIKLVLNNLSSLALDVCVLPQVKEVFSHYFF